MFVCVAGKNNIAVEVLEYLILNNNGRYELGVVCNKNESGSNSWQRSLRNYAGQKDIKEYALKDIYNKKNVVFLSMEFDQIIKPELFMDARLYNIHFSLLPLYKGMYTSSIPILNGDKYAGVTFHEIDSGIDTGDIIKQRKFVLEANITCRELYLMFIRNGIELVLECIEDVLNGNIRAIPQDASGSTYYSKKYIDYSNLSIDLNQTACSIDRQIRAFSFREYQLPEVHGRKIIATKITNIKSTQKAGTIILETEDAMVLSTIDYNIVLYFDRLEELLEACKCGELTKVKSICSVAAHLNSVNEKGWSPLIVATYNNQIEVVKYLIAQGANVYVKNNNGTNLLMYAKDVYYNSGDVELYKLYTRLGLSPKWKDYANFSLYDYVLSRGDDLEEFLNKMNS